MRVIIAGGRDFADKSRLFDVCCEFVPEGSTVLCGMARGADELGYEWAQVYRRLIEEYPADWEQWGKAAGYRRNAEMAENADTLIAFWDGKSKGTKHMIDLAFQHGLEVHVYRY